MEENKNNQNIRVFPKIKNVFEWDAQNEFKNMKYDTEYSKFLENVQFTATEKYDGTNVRIYFDGYKVSYYGRTPRSTFGKVQIEWLDNFIKDKEIYFEQVFENKPTILYGELYGGNLQFSIDKNPYGKEMKIVFFDILVGTKWIKNVEETLKKMGLSYVNRIDNGSAHSLAEWRNKANETYEQELLNFKEGWVLKPIIPIFDENENPIKFKIKFNDCKKWNDQQEAESKKPKE